MTLNRRIILVYTDNLIFSHFFLTEIKTMGNLEKIENKKNKLSSILSRHTALKNSYFKI